MRGLSPSPSLRAPGCLLSSQLASGWLAKWLTATLADKRPSEYIYRISAHANFLKLYVRGNISYIIKNVVNTQAATATMQLF